MKIEADYFKSSGKWYMSEEFEVPDYLDVYDIRKWITDNRPHKNNFVMVINSEEATNIIGFPMMDFPTTD